MKSLFAYFFTITIFIQPVTALAADYSDFDSFCQTLQQNELEFIKKEVEEGEMTEAEAKEEIDYLPKVEQCVCFFQKVLEGTGADFTLYIQKRAEIETVANEDFLNEEVEKMEMPKYPEGLDIGAFMIDIDKACGLDPE